MNKARLKQILTLAVLLTGGVAVVVITVQAARVVERTGSGAEAEDALTELRVPVDPASIEWLPDGTLPRPMEADTRDAVGESYLLALALLDGTLTVDSVEDLAVHLTGPALTAASDAGSSPTPLGRSHQLQVVFYSADGQLVELEDIAWRLYSSGNGDALLRSETAVSVLIRIDGVWHLRHRVVETSSSDIVSLSALTDTSKE